MNLTVRIGLVSLAVLATSRPAAAQLDNPPPPATPVTTEGQSAAPPASPETLPTEAVPTPAAEAPAAPSPVAVPSCAPPDLSAPQLVNILDKQLGPAPVLNVGPVAQSLLSELFGQLCVGFETQAAMPNTCGSPGFPIAELRSRLALDLLHAPLAYARQLGQENPLETRVAFAALDALSSHLAPAEFATQIAVALGYASGTGGCEVPQVTGTDSLGVAVLLYWRLSQDAAAAVQRTEAETEALIARTLVDVGSPVASAIDAQRAAIEALATSNAAAQQRWQDLRSAPSNVSLAAFLTAELEALQAALSLATGQPSTLPPEAFSAVRALSEARLDDLVTALEGWLVARAQLSQEVLDTASTALRFAAASNQEEAERIVRGLVLGLGPWSEDWIASGTAGVPVFNSNTLNVTGDATLGYNAKHWGFLAHGSLNEFYLENSTVDADGLDGGGNGDAWLALQIGDSTDLEIRGTVDVRVLSTSTVFKQAGSVADEDSLFIRGGGLLGLRTQSPTWALGLWAGGGFQVESYNPSVASAGRFVAPENDVVAGAIEGRLRAQWQAWQEVLALRLAVDWKFHTLSRVSSTIDTNSTNVLTEVDQHAQQIDAKGRLFLDAETFKLFGFVPGVGVGFDHQELAVSGQNTVTSTVPVFLAGIRRTIF
jgi:hypothetical protein